MIYALHAGLGGLLDEGLEASHARHQACGDRIQAGLVDMGFARLRRTLLDRYGIEIGVGVGECAGKVWRIGRMGHTARPRNVTLPRGALAEIMEG